MKKLRLFLASAYTTSFLFAMTGSIPVMAQGDALRFCAGGINAPGCEGSQSIVTIINAILNIAFLASFLLVLAFLVWGGIKWVLAQGEKEGIQKARDQVTNSLVGLAIILASFLIVNLVLQLVLGQKLGDLSTFSLKSALQ